MFEPAPPGRERHGRRRALLILAVLGVVMLLVIGGAGGYYVWATGASGERTPVTVDIPEGSSTTAIAELLEGRGVIRSALMFRVVSRMRGLGGTFEAGLYELTTNMPLNGVLDALAEGPVPPPTVKFGVPEGLRVEAVAKRAADKLGLPEKGFREAATSGRFRLPGYIPDGVKTLEGFLFPKVYEFLPNPTVDGVIERMLRQFEAEVEDLPWENADALGVSRYEIVVIASLIEREALVPQDRGKISRVIHNRLAEDHPLEIDATIQYILGENRPILLVERELESPYNTYLHAGLPPTPIASPGRASIEAALNPTPGDWFFYVVIDCETGEHGFTNKEGFSELFASAPDCV